MKKCYVSPQLKPHVVDTYMPLVSSLGNPGGEIIEMPWDDGPDNGKPGGKIEEMPWDEGGSGGSKGTIDEMPWS